MINPNYTLFLDACARKPTDRTPVWYMRQAGRCLPEYRALKEKYDILTLCRTPELAAQVTLMPIDRFGVDAAILFADIMLPLIGMGVELDIVERVGPVIARPVRNMGDVQMLRSLDHTVDFDYLKKTIAILRGELAGRVPLIGFSGAPFTLASYLIEGKPSRDFLETKKIMYGQGALWHALMQKLTDSVIFYLKLQVDAGVQAVQLFDSWAGALSRGDYVEYALPYSRQIFEALSGTSEGSAGGISSVPRIHFGTNTSHFLKEFASVPCEVVGVDWRLSIGEAWESISSAGYARAIQGNLEPAILLCDFDSVKKKVDAIFSALPRREGFIFNLGHGVLPDTPADTLVRLTEYVHSK